MNGAIKMKKSEIEQTLFLNGWLSPVGLLGKNSVFDAPERPVSLFVTKSVFFPLSSILGGGDVSHRILLTCECGRSRDQDGPQSIEIQERSTVSKDWITQTIHTPAQFLFKLAADEFSQIPGQGKDAQALMRFASDNGFTSCLGTETTLGQVTLRSDDPENDQVFLRLAFDHHGNPAVEIMAGRDMIMGFPAIPVAAFESDPAEATRQIIDRMKRAQEHVGQKTSLTKRLTAWFSPR